MITVWLKKARDKPSRRGHPWVFSGSIAGVDGDPKPGETVRVVDRDGTFVALGQISPASQIRIRLLEWGEGVAVDGGWWRGKIAGAIELRRTMKDRIRSDAYRLVHAEADLLPGLVVDYYNGHVVLQALTAGIEAAKEEIAGHLDALLDPVSIIERSDVDVRAYEGLDEARGVLKGEQPPASVEIHEESFTFSVDIAGGQKTGFYLDQRDNRAKVASYTGDASVLDCFAYTGAFSIHALGAGARDVTLIESSSDALQTARRNLSLNSMQDRAVELIEGSVPHVLRSFRDARRSFDVVILDPPKFARSKSQVGNAARAYKDVNLLAMKLLRPAGILATFSCSGGVGSELFGEIINWAARDAGREVQIIERLGQGVDHPVRPAFPESEYLKGFVCRVV